MTSNETATVLKAVAERVGPAVVGLGPGWGRGSGIVVAPGAVLTVLHEPGHRRGRRGGGPARHHVPEDPGELTVRFAGGRTAEARVAGTDPLLGLSVLAVDTGDVTPVAPAPDATPPGLGTPVVALGDPGGRGLRAAPGWVTAGPRAVPDGRGLRREAGIEHSAPLPRGAAGGPLVDTEGRLLGVNVMRPAPGLILALATGPDVAARALAVVAGTAPTPRTLGVALAPPHVARRLRAAVGLPDVTGVLVREVVTGSPAERAGVAPGDLITGAAGAPVDGVATLARAVDGADGTLALELVRGTETRAVEVTFTAAT